MKEGSHEIFQNTNPAIPRADKNNKNMLPLLFLLMIWMSKIIMAYECRAWNQQGSDAI